MIRVQQRAVDQDLRTLGPLFEELQICEDLPMVQRLLRFALTFMPGTADVERIFSRLKLPTARMGAGTEDVTRQLFVAVRWNSVGYR